MLDKIKNFFGKKPNDKKPKTSLTNKEYEQLGRRMEQVYVSGYANKGRLMYMSFVRGIGYGVGIFIGGTIVVGIVLTTLVQFQEMPIIGPFVEKINNTIETGSQVDLSSEAATTNSSN